jgi:2-keto-3-deoxy-L-rhamnonate aldolase RhmA
LKTNTLKRKLREGKVCFGTFLTIGNPDITDTLKHLGFEWFVFDTEHSCITFETVKGMQEAISDTDICPIVRIGEIDQYLVKRALDIGSQGLLVPLVNSADDARRVVEFAMYPPKGNRGAGPGRALQSME